MKRREELFFAAKGSRTFFSFLMAGPLMGWEGPAILEKKYFFTLKEIQAATKIVGGGPRPLNKRFFFRLPLNFFTFLIQFLFREAAKKVIYHQSKGRPLST